MLISSPPGGAKKVFHLYCHVSPTGELIAEAQPSKDAISDGSSVHSLTALNDRIGSLFRALSLSSGKHIV